MTRLMASWLLSHVMQIDGATALLLATTSACGLNTPQPEAATVHWLAGGLGRCTSLIPAARPDTESVIAACDRGAVEVSSDAKVTTIHPTMVDHVALSGDQLWLKLPDRLLQGQLPAPGQTFETQHSLRLSTIDDILAVPGSPLVVATPGTLVHVSTDAVAARWRKVPVPMHQLTAGPDGEIWAVSHDAIHAVERRKFRQVVGGLSSVAAAAVLPSGSIVVASGSPAQLSTISDGRFTPSGVFIEGLTDLAAIPGDPAPRLWFTTSDGSIGYTTAP